MSLTASCQCRLRSDWCMKATGNEVIEWHFLIDVCLVNSSGTITWFEATCTVLAEEVINVMYSSSIANTIVKNLYWNQTISNIVNASNRGSLSHFSPLGGREVRIKENVVKKIYIYTVWCVCIQ